MLQAILQTRKSLSAALALLAGSYVNAGQWQAPLEHVQTQYIVRQYHALSDSAEQLADASATLCATPTAHNLAVTKQAFINNVDAWQTLQWLNFGPVTYFMRYYAYEYWPDKKGITQRQLRSLKSAPETIKAPEFWRSASIAVQGTTALEALLYRNDFDVMADSDDCTILEAISKHHAQASREVLQQWQTTSASHWVYQEDGGDKSAGYLALEQLLQQWLEHMSVVKDSKLESPIGYQKHPSLKLAEFYPSGQSLAAIITNLKAYRMLYHAGSPSIYDSAKSKQAKRADALDRALADNLKIALQLPQDYFTGDYAQQERIAMAKPLIHALANSQAQLTDLVTALGFQIGFNSRDGD